MRHLAALTALLVVLAGCSGAPGGDAAAPESTTVDATTVADGTTTTDAATETTTAESTTSEPADETETASATDPDRPPGLSASGVANAEALAAAHADALANESYPYRREATVVAANGS